MTTLVVLVGVVVLLVTNLIMRIQEYRMTKRELANIRDAVETLLIAGRRTGQRDEEMGTGKTKTPE